MFVCFFFYFHIQGEPGSDGAAGKDVSVALWERGRTFLYVAGFIYFPLLFFYRVWQASQGTGARQVKK